MVLSALGVEEYNLPESIEKMTPLGAKLVIEKIIGLNKYRAIQYDFEYSEAFMSLGVEEFLKVEII